MAKEMMLDFYRHHDAIQPGFLRATYLVAGVRTFVDDDLPMTDADDPAEDAPILTISIVPCVKLSEALAHYQHVTSVHIYSLSRDHKKDMKILADVWRQMIDTGDAFTAPKQYGAITALGLALLDSQFRGAGSDEVTSFDHKSHTRPPQSALEIRYSSDSSATEETTSSNASSGIKTLGSNSKKLFPGSVKPSTTTTTLFARVAVKPKRLKSPARMPETESPVMLSASQHDDNADYEHDSPTPPANYDSDLKDLEAKKERQDQLRKMMEIKDGEDDDRQPHGHSEAVLNEPSVAEAKDAECPGRPHSQAGVTTDGPVSTKTEDSRQRGRRRIMRKKQVMDDQGYLVTLQEAAWESFSEEESSVLDSKKQAKPSTLMSSRSASQVTKAKKPITKGQGSIASFFSKK
jgi:DNA polymerase delta subunit 3